MKTNSQPQTAIWWQTLLSLLIGLAIAQPILADESREVAYLPVSSQPAEQLLEVLRPLVGGGTLMAHGDQLIVQGTPVEIATLREALERLDRAPRRLMLEVRLAEQSLADTESGHRSGARVIGTRRQQDRGDQDGDDEIQQADAGMGGQAEQPDTGRSELGLDRAPPCDGRRVNSSSRTWVISNWPRLAS